VGGYLLGDNIHWLTGPIGPITLVLAVLLIIAGIVVLRRNEERLAAEAERAFPGPLGA
jgi:threonine dehydrogenase-like Zn-dependent dehydrogenase